MSISEKRCKFLLTMACMSEESFGWVVGAVFQKRIWPDGRGGFKPESREDIESLEKAAMDYFEVKDGE